MASNFNLNKFKSLIDSASKSLKGAANSGKDALKKGAEQAKSAGRKLILYIPKDYQGYNKENGSSLNELIKAADDLGIEVHRSEKDQTALAKELFGTAEKLLGFSERGIALFAPQLDKLLNKNQKLSKAFGNSSSKLGDTVSKTKSAIATIQSFLGTALAGMQLDELIKRKNNGEDVHLDLAQAGVDLTAQLIESISNTTNTIDAFSEQLSKLGNALANTKLSGLGNKLGKIPNLGAASPGFEVISSLLSVISASFILGKENAHAGTKAAAGLEISGTLLGNIGKYISQYIIAQRAAAGLSTTAATGGLIASVVALAISPLSFLNAADQFNKAKELENYAERFKKLGYEGDSLLGSFYRESGTVEASLTTIKTVLGAISAGVSGAATGSLIGTPVAALVSAITGIISGILDASKQAIFENIASKLAGKIEEWEQKHGGKNYFENGYDARHKAFLEDSLELLSKYNEEYSVDHAVAITQQRWDGNIGELAGITRKGALTKSGKAYVDFFEEGKRLDSSKFENKVFDPTQGTINLSHLKKKSLLTFVTPTLTAGEEIRNRKGTGKYQYLTELFVKGKDKWVVDGVKEHSSVYNFTNLIQHALTLDGKLRQVTIESNLGSGDDRVYLTSGSSIVNAGEGNDTVHYDKTDTGYLTIDATKAQKAGEYTVSKYLGADVKLLKEVVKNQEVKVGKRTEIIQYRDYELGHIGDVTATDQLHSVETIIGGNRNDKFLGGKFNDIFHGANGDDHIEGNDGDDILYGDNGNDKIYGGNGNDYLVGGDGNDTLVGNQGNDFLNGGNGNDDLQAAGGKYNVLVGGAGDDTLSGSHEGTNLLDGGTGNDKLYGGAQKDIYRYSNKYGRHIIQEEGGNDDTLVLSDLSFEDIGFIRIGDDLVMNKKDSGTINFSDHDNGNAITFKNWFKNKKYEIEKIIDKNGHLLSSENLTQLTKDNYKGLVYKELQNSLDKSKNYASEIGKEIDEIISHTGILKDKQELSKDETNKELADVISRINQLKDKREANKGFVDILSHIGQFKDEKTPKQVANYQSSSQDIERMISSISTFAPRSRESASSGISLTTTVNSIGSIISNSFAHVA
ncbi:RTX family hemolysin [Pasteurella multocida]|uniref:RTX family hemolysin n=1 Tax=Pasteurella multocida TaxID=747 RepID=UPI00244D1B47|nr:RTX family hemolysin [Pasteurella multocida]MDH3003097.1 RTX toxin hemolysin A [Pasteurella multocida]